MMDSVAFQTFEQFHGKQNIGSTRIRVHQLLKYWPEACLYTYGLHPQTLIFQKVYCTEDYKFPDHYPGIRVLDVCDPDFLDGALVRETSDAMHAIVTPTEHLAAFFRQLTDNPVVVIPDRYDLEDFPPPKEHTESAKTVIWFGYRHNIETLKPAMDLINKCGLNLIVVADDDPMPWQWLGADMQEFRYARYKFIKYDTDPKKVHQDIQLADFAVLPKGTRPQDVFKSDNKATRAILCGIPVAYNSDDVRALISPENRSKFMAERYEQTREDFRVEKSVSQYQELITELVAKNPNL